MEHTRPESGPDSPMSDPPYEKYDWTKDLPPIPHTATSGGARPSYLLPEHVLAELGLTKSQRKNRARKARDKAARAEARLAEAAFTEAAHAQADDTSIQGEKAATKRRACSSSRAGLRSYLKRRKLDPDQDVESNDIDMEGEEDAEMEDPVGEEQGDEAQEGDHRKDGEDGEGEEEEEEEEEAEEAEAEEEEEEEEEEDEEEDEEEEEEAGEEENAEEGGEEEEEDEEGEGEEYVVDAILRKRYRDGELKWLVLWETGEKTWEPIECLQDCQAWIDFEAR